MKKSKRKYIINVPVSLEEKEKIVSDADNAGMMVATFIRATVLDRIEKGEKQ